MLATLKNWFHRNIVADTDESAKLSRIDADLDRLYGSYSTRGH